MDFEIMEAGQKPTSNYQKTSISVVGDARFLMSWFIIPIPHET